VYWLIVLLSIVTNPISAQQMLSSIPDTIFHNGKIITVDNESNIVEAFAVRNERFLVVGNDIEVMSLAGPDTQLIDLKGQVIVPGFIDNHNHQYHLALLTLRGIDMQNISSVEQMLDRLQHTADSTEPGQTIFTRMDGWSPGDLAENRAPTLQELDRVSQRHPIIIFESRQRLHINTAALIALGLDQDTLSARVEISRNENGEPTGMIQGRGAAALHLSARAVPPPTLEEKKALLVKMQVQQHAMGLTGIRDLQLFPDVMRAYFELWREGALTMRTSMGLELNAGEEADLEQMLSPWGVGSGFGDEWLRIDGIAEFNPGDLLREPYSDTGDIGELRTSEQSFKEAILIMNRYGWRPAIHIQGDRTLDLVLDAFEAANNEQSILGRRWIVEHVPLVHTEQMERIKRLGVMVSAQYQPYTGARSMLRQFGRERLEQALPMRDFLDQGIIVSGGSDWPSYPNNPILNIYFYVTRNSLDLGPVGVEQRISRMEALRVMTLNNAYLTYEEKIKGSIEEGKLADFVILSEDLLTVPESQIQEITPLATYVGGRNVYSKPGGGF
jgi:predicted amidohydrolase YtcJ